jgi:hypothetical protein
MKSAFRLPIKCRWFQGLYCALLLREWERLFAETGHKYGYRRSNRTGIKAERSPENWSETTYRAGIAKQNDRLANDSRDAINDSLRQRRYITRPRVAKRTLGIAKECGIYPNGVRSDYASMPMNFGVSKKPCPIVVVIWG